MEVTTRDIHIDGHHLPVMNINMKDSSIVSIPSQIGCPVNCDFCISKESKFVRSLKARELVTLAEAGLQEALSHTLMSFTGEGEPILNAANINHAIEKLEDKEQIKRFRISMSGIKSENLGHIASHGKPINLQFSMHSPFDETRQKLIQHTQHLDKILNNIRKYQDKFAEVAINYVLMQGVNDGEEDLSQLIKTVDKNRIIKLNVLLDSKKYQPSENTDMFHQTLLAEGFDARRYSKIGSTIRNNLYESLTYKK